MIEPEQAARFRRELAAMVRAAGDDPEAFATVAGLIDSARVAMHGAVTELREQGFSYSDIGRALGVSKQAAQQRFAAPRP